MRAILLATGESNKLWPLTETLPAPLLPVANRPVMAYTIESLVQQGIRRIAVTLHRHPDQIALWAGSGSQWGVELEYLLQQQAWGTAGALHWAEGWLNNTFLVIPADTLADIDIRGMVAWHRAGRNIATFHIHVDHPDKNVALGSDSRILQLEATDDGWPAGYATGICILEPEALGAIPTGSVVDIVGDLIPNLLAQGMRVGSYCGNGYYNPLSTFADYQEAQRHYLLSAWDEGRPQLNGTRALVYPSLSGQHVAPGVWSGENNVIHPRARLAPPVLIGDNCHIGPDVELGPDVVIGNDVVIGEGASIHQSTILPHTCVGELVQVKGILLQDNLMISAQRRECTSTRPFSGR